MEGENEEKAGSQATKKELLKILSCFSGININYVDPQQHFLASSFNLFRFAAA